MLLLAVSDMSRMLISHFTKVILPKVVQEDHAQPGWTTSRRGQDSPWKSQSEWQRTGINGKSTSMVWPTLGSRTTEEKNILMELLKTVGIFKHSIHFTNRQPWDNLTTKVPKTLLQITTRCWQQDSQRIANLPVCMHRQMDNRKTQCLRTHRMDGWRH